MKRFQIRFFVIASDSDSVDRYLKSLSTCKMVDWVIHSLSGKSYFNVLINEDDWLYMKLKYNPETVVIDFIPT